MAPGTEHSLGDHEIIADVPSMSLEDSNDTPHMLKSFHMWMEAGTAKKSAKPYTEAVKRLIVSHGKALEGMRHDKYLEFVKSSSENRKGNSMVSAALKKLLHFFDSRDQGAEGPWEHRAAHFEQLYNIARGSAPWGGKSTAKVNASWGGKSVHSSAQENKITSLFKVETPPKRNRDGVAENSGGSEEQQPSSSAKVAKQSHFTLLQGTALTPEQIAIIEANRAAALERRAARLQLPAQLEERQVHVS
mmetsp:Transcript_93504/g.180258  ORF Transcript_93504/g.180258 Transcript_93504/m.180258 type:complete len:247 (+) Transcript_93504:60-800(+)